MTTETPAALTPVAETLPTDTSLRGRLVRLVALLRDSALRALDAVKLITERVMSFLRLFATVGLALIVSLVVFKAIQSANLVLVKPFTVAKGVQDLNPDSGRVIANQLNHELRDAELSIYSTVKGNGQDAGGRSARSNQTELDQITGNSGDFLLGSNIKLPDTGISINDVVEFISSVFGRRNIIGSVYQDQNKLFMQVELGEHVFTYQRDLGTRDPKALNFDLIKEMLYESRFDLLSAASAPHNLYYYCSGKTDFIGHQDSRYTQWFAYCSTLNNPQLTPENLGELITKLEQLNQTEGAKLERESLIVQNVLQNTLANAKQKTHLLCPDYAQTNVCQAPVTMASAAPKAAPAPIEPPDPAGVPVSAHPNLPDATAFQPETAIVAMMKMANPNASNSTLSNLGLPTLPAPNTLVDANTLKNLWAQCSSKPTVSSTDSRASNQTEADATLLFNNKRYPQAVGKYLVALQQNCKNAFAWANLGVLLTGQNQAAPARVALETAVTINNRVDWMHNSLCIALAYGDPPAQMEQRLNDATCNTARSINPANRVVLDKQFYLAVADRYFDSGLYPQATNAYQTALSIERKRDCNTSKAVSNLYLLATQYSIAGAWQAACDIRDAALPLADGKISNCDADLTKLQCPPAN